MVAIDSLTDAAHKLKLPSFVGRLKPLWPVIACGLGMFLLSAIGFAMLERLSRVGGRLQWYHDTIVVSSLLAQIALATIIGGLITRHWLTGWLLAVALACLQTVMATVIAEFPNLTGPSAVQHVVLCSIWPVFLLSTCAPLVVLRTLFGWTLSRQGPTAIGRWRSSMEDLLLVGIVIACSITTSQMFLYSEGPQNLPQLMMVMGIFATTSFICIPPVVYVSFRSRTWKRRIIGWLLLFILAFVVIFVESAIMDGGGFKDSWRALPEMFVGMTTSSLTIAVGIVSLMASGYRLTHFERLTKTNPSTLEPQAIASEPAQSDSRHSQSDVKAPFEAEWLDDAQPVARASSFEFTPQWQARLITLVFIGIAALGALGVHWSKLRNLRFYEELDQPKLTHAYLNKQTVTGLDFGPQFVDSDLKEYLKYRSTITTLSFAGTKVTDAIIPQLKDFPSLRELDLSGTAITDAGLQQLSLPNQHMPDPQGTLGFLRLSLADTNVTWAAVKRLVESNSIHHLDLSGLNISDQDLATRIPVTSLRLSRNPVTDEGIRVLLENSSIRSLDVSDTFITGSTLSMVGCPGRLNLDGTEITDTTLTDILNTGRVNEISLRDTRVTAAILPLLRNLSVRLGKGAIKEDDLATMGPANFIHLGLNDKQFTGKCMTIGTVTTNSLDLSGSSVTDNILMMIGGTGKYYQFIGIANTQASDACMPYLKVSGEIDLRGTRITATGLSATPMNRIVLSHNQFSPKELTALHNTNLEFILRPLFNNWPE